MAINNNYRVKRVRALVFVFIWSLIMFCFPLFATFFAEEVNMGTTEAFIFKACLLAFSILPPLFYMYQKRLPGFFFLSQSKSKALETSSFLRPSCCL